MSRFFINRPIFASVIAIIIVIAGGVTLLNLPIAQYPEISPPTIQVSASYPGASAKVVSESVAQPIEEQVNGVENMLYMSSTCSNDGSYSLTVTFETGTDLDMATVLVQNRVAIAEASLPDTVKRLGVVTKKRSTDIVLMLALTSSDEHFDALYLSNYATLNIKDELSRLQGVGDVTIFGAGDYSMRIWMNPDQLQARGLTTNEVVAAIQEQNVQVAAGQLGQPPLQKGQAFQYAINAQGRLDQLSEFEDIIVKTGTQGRVTRLKDVASTELGARSYGTESQYMGRETAMLAIYQLPGANAIDLAARVRGKMEDLSQSFPSGLSFEVPLDTTDFVQASIDEVIETLLIAIVLVFMVIFAFLQDWRATLIPAVTIPVSLIGTFAVMGLLGFSLNMLTLFGLVLAIGIVVDDAIVVVENTARNIEELGLETKEATIRAMQEVSGPIVSTTLVLLSVFVPTAFMGGISGQMYMQFALTIAASTVFSAINALTLSPALSALLLRPAPEKKNIFFRAFNRVFGFATNGYLGLMGGLVRKSFLVLLLFAGLTALTGWGFLQLPTGFVPTEDQGYILATAQLPDGASFARTQEVTEQMNEIFAHMDGIDSWVNVAGFSLLDGTVASNAATSWIVLSPWEERTSPELSQDGLLKKSWQALGQIKKAQIQVFAPPPISGLGVSGGFSMELQDRGGQGFQALQNMAQEISQDADSQSGLQNVYSTFRANVPQYLITLNRTKAKSMGVQLSNIFNTLQAYLGSAYVNDFTKFGRNYQVKVQAEAGFRSHAEDITRLEVANAQGQMLPLGTVLDVERVFGPQIISRYNMYPAASVSGSPAPGYSSGQAMDIMEDMFGNKLPPGMGFEWTGVSFQEKVAGGSMVLIFGLAIVFVYLVLCAQYESWGISFGVILAVPLALLGTVAALFIRGMDVNVYTQIGIVLLIALACKNAILIIEFARDARIQGMKTVDAALEAAKLRFRPILMTSFAFILGVFPLVIAAGAGAASRQALGTAVFGGMIAATFLSVVFVPCIYVVIQSATDWIQGKR
ncbi:MAG: multidrug efflux RND transporter permease subunit [Desulfovermiculus sp.]